MIKPHKLLPGIKFIYLCNNGSDKYVNNQLLKFPLFLKQIPLNQGKCLVHGTMTDGRMTRALGLPSIPVNGALLKERAPCVAHTCHCSGLQPWDTTWGVQGASRSQISTISSVHPGTWDPRAGACLQHSCQSAQYVLAAERGMGMGRQSPEQVSCTTHDISEKGQQLNLTIKFTFLRLLHHKVCKLLWKHFRFLCHFSKTFCNSDMILI